MKNHDVALDRDNNVSSHPKVKQGDTITWKITDRDLTLKFPDTRLVLEENGTILTERSNRKGQPPVKLKVRSDVVSEQEYPYFIFWKKGKERGFAKGHHSHPIIIGA